MPSPARPIQGFTSEKLQIDAADGRDSGRRRKVAARIQSLDQVLSPQKRRRVQASTNYLDRNFSVAAWAIRRHLDYVSTFNFQPRSGDESLDRDLVEMVKEWSTADNWDAAGRHPRNRFMRILEGRRVIDGDIGALRIRDGTVQGIESDRVRDPDQHHWRAPRRAGRTEDPEWVHGVRRGPAGRAVQYAISRRSPWGSYTTERLVSARDMHLVGYFTSFDQVRGTSPMISAINSYQDVYESLDMALIKQKVSQILALITYREDNGGMAEASADGEPETDFTKGPVQLNFDRDDKAEILESRNPSTESQAFWQTVIAIALKSLDLPYSFYDESFTNFFGSRSAWIHYERSARQKREDLQELLDKLTAWRLALWKLAGDLRLPRSIPLSSIKWQWCPLGTDYWNPVQEITADILAIEAGLMTRAEVRKSRFGDDWRPVAAALGKEQEILESHGVSTSFAKKTETMEMINADARK